MAKCTGKRCPMQVGFKVDECNYKECPYRTEPITNADYIRMMSDEELSGIIRVIHMSEECPIGTLECETCFFKEVCAGAYCGKEVEWLQQPAEDDDYA